MPVSPLLDTLPTEQRLALAYAPAASAGEILALLALDARMASIVRELREPVLLQIRLAWWRDRLAGLVSASAPAEPLLQQIAVTWRDCAPLVGLVDGWEAFALPDGDFADGADRLARARGQTFAALAAREAAGETERAGHAWALADLAARLHDPQERAAVLALGRDGMWHRAMLPRALRPLAVLHALARRRHDGTPLLSGPGALACAVRVGMFGA